MAVTGTTRRERVRASDGSRPLLPGSVDPVGLSAIATTARAAPGAHSPSALTDAGRAAVYVDPVTPHTEAVLLVQSTADPGVDATTFPVVRPAGWTTELEPLEDVPTGPTTAPFAAFVLDRDRLDDPAATLRPVTGEEPFRGLVPTILRPSAQFDRLIGNPGADPAGAAWAVGSGWDENLIPNPTAATGVAGWAPNGGTLSRQATDGAVGASHLRMTGTGSYVGLRSQVVGPVSPGGLMSASLRLRGTAGVVVQVRVRFVEQTESGSQWLPEGPATTYTLTGTWTAVTINAVQYPAGRATGGAFLEVSTASTVPAGTIVDVDAVKVRRGATAGTYGDGTTGAVGSSGRV